MKTTCIEEALAIEKEKEPDCLPGTQIRFDDVRTPMITVQEYLEPTGSCLSIIQTNNGKENTIHLSDYTAAELIKALSYFVTIQS